LHRTEVNEDEAAVSLFKFLEFGLQPFVAKLERLVLLLQLLATLSLLLE
jgi:hypothetical protein